MVPLLQLQKSSSPGFIPVINNHPSLPSDVFNQFYSEGNRPHAAASELVNAHEADRADMAYTLSEHISQILVASRLYIECAMKDESQRLGLLEESRNLVITALKEINTLAKSLSPVTLKEAGLLETINELANDTSALTGIHFSTRWDEFEEELPGEKLKLTLFRITQEYIKYMVEKSNPANVEIGISCGKNSLRLSIGDDGVPMHRATLKKELFFQHIQRRSLLHHGKTPAYVPGSPNNTFSIQFPL